MKIALIRRRMSAKSSGSSPDGLTNTVVLIAFSRGPLNTRVVGGTPLGKLPTGRMAVLVAFQADVYLILNSFGRKRRRRVRPPQIERRSWFVTGSARMRWPVAAKIALHKAGASGGTGGSPTPPQKSPLGTITLTTSGASAMRSIS